MSKENNINEILWYIFLGIAGTTMLATWGHLFVTESLGLAALGWIVALVMLFLVHGIRVGLKFWKKQAMTSPPILFSPGVVVHRLLLLYLTKEKETNSINRRYLKQDSLLTTILLNEMITTAGVDLNVVQRLSDELEGALRRIVVSQDMGNKEMSLQACRDATKDTEELLKIRNKINKLFNYPLEVEFTSL